MPKRRKVLIGLGGSIALAGCSGETEEPESENQDQTEEDDSEEEGSEPEETEQEPAQAEFTEISPENPTVVIGEDFEINAELANTGGEAGEFEVELRLEGETVSTGTFEIAPGESEPVSVSMNTEIIGEEIGPGEYEHKFVTDGDEISTTVTYVEPEPEETESVYQVRIQYDGEWSGTVGGDGSTRSVDGSGTETFDIEGDPFIVSANAQKRDGSTDELTIQILENGEVIAEKSTSAEYGVVQITSEDGISEDSSGSDGTNEDSSGGSSGSTFEVRIEYSGEWSGSVGGDGSVRSVDGSGSETIEIEGTPDIISANAQKQEANSEELVIQILENGEVVEESSTSAEYGVVQISYSNF